MNVIEIGLAFIEGLALIASPCILPVLPLVLGTSVNGGKKRPFGIIFGFVLSFTVFALLSRKLVIALGVNLDIFKYLSLIFLGLFAIIMFSERLSAIFSKITQNLANAGNKLSNNSEEGFAGGILIGVMIGLVWTPCAGPVLAVALVQIIRQQSDLQALWLVASFAMGAGVPMLIIAITGRTIMNRLKFFAIHAEAMRKIFAVIILIAVLFIGSGLNLQALSTNKQANSQEKTTMFKVNANLENALENPYPAPDFIGIDGWLNSAPLTIKSLKGKVVLIDFWTYSCINCIRTLPYITSWNKEYRDKGLVIIGVHAPEFEFEKNINNIKNALLRYNITYPVALDNNLDTWTAFDNHYWPAHYLINQNGQVIYTHFGEGNYSETENNIRNLLGLDKKLSSTHESSTSINQTPETYLGSRRAESFASSESIEEDRQVFSFPAFISSDHWALSGKWKIEEEKIISQEVGAKLRLNFTAGKVFLVLGSQTDKEVIVNITLNGKPVENDAGKDVENGVIKVKDHRLYELINQGDAKNSLLEITAESNGLEAYAFTFGQNAN